MNPSPIRVLLVDDSKAFRSALKRQFRASSVVDVVGEVGDAMRTIETVLAVKPDVVVLDLNMPGVNGFEILTQLRPTMIPTIVVSGVPKERTDLVQAAMKRGAFALVRKPQTSAETKAFVSTLEEKITAAVRFANVSAPATDRSAKPALTPDNRLVAIGASTGGTRALTTVLSGFGEDCPPIVIAQHMMPSMLALFAKQLNSACAIAVRLAEKGDVPERGTALLAPGGQHLLLSRRGKNRIVCELNTDAKVEGQRPAVDVLFWSVAKIARGKNVVGIVLTGMGRDGASGLLEMREAGCTTVIEDERDCVVFGMPKAALDVGAAMRTERLSNISSFVTSHYKD